MHSHVFSNPCDTLLPTLSMQRLHERPKTAGKACFQPNSLFYVRYLLNKITRLSDECLSLQMHFTFEHFGPVDLVFIVLYDVIEKRVEIPAE